MDGEDATMFITLGTLAQREAFVDQLPDSYCVEGIEGLEEKFKEWLTDERQGDLNRRNEMKYILLLSLCLFFGCQTKEQAITPFEENVIYKNHPDNIGYSSISPGSTERIKGKPIDCSKIIKWYRKDLPWPRVLYENKNGTIIIQIDKRKHKIGKNIEILKRKPYWYESHKMRYLYEVYITN